MGFWKNTVLGLPLPTTALPTALVSPWSDSQLESAFIGELFPELADTLNTVITEEIAARVPGVTRSLQAHTALVAQLRFEVYKDGVKLEDQPAWVYSSASGISPYIRNVSTIKDLFYYGWALWGGELDAFGTPTDFIHIPKSRWDVDGQTGQVQVHDSIPAKYRQRLVLIPLGTNGLLTDAVDTLRQARILEHSRQARLASPPAATELHITDATKDEMTAKEREALAKSWTTNRTKYATTVTPSYIEVKDHNSTKVDLFSEANNSLVLDLANHCGVPASFIEGVSGSGSGDMSYQNKDDANSDLYVFGSARFTNAIQSRLSMDDVAGPKGFEVRADLTPIISTPLPAIADPTED